jgi:manganese-dependent inorganic pyrophosphatase
LPRVYVTGHRNPDTDSIAAAVGYAELKGQTDPENEYVPVRLGSLNPQTTWAIEASGAAVPEFLPHVQLRVMDVMRDTFPVAHEDDPVRVVGQELVREGLDLLPVIDDDGILVGVLTERALARRYVRESREASRLESATRISSLVSTLEGELLSGDADSTVSGRVWVVAMDLPTMLNEVAAGDVAVVGDRPDAQRRALETDLGALVISNDVRPSDELLAFASAQNTPVIRTRLDSYVSGRMITLAAPCRALLEREPLTVGVDDLVQDISTDVKDVSYRAAVVVDRKRRPIGLVTRADLVRPRARRVLLVDHAEQAQSVPGVEEAEIVEILDHHHIGSIETKHPVVATFDPVGSTSTLVSERFDQAAIVPSKSTATLLLAAILSDTVILNSPTATPRDRTAMQQLAELAGVDPVAFGREMFTSTSDVSSVPASDLVTRDAKSYELGNGQSIGIAQVETVGAVPDERTDELLAAVQAECERGGYRLFALMLTDVLAQGTRLIVAGDVPFAELAFGQPATRGVIELDGVMSRKKQVAPRLMAA